MICTNPSRDRRAYEVTEEEEEDDAQDRYGNQDVIADNLQYSFSSTFHTFHEDLEMEDPEEGECDEAMEHFDTQITGETRNRRENTTDST